MQRISIAIGLLALCILLGSMSAGKKAPKQYKQRLSEYGFFEGDLADLKPSKDVHPYALNSPLFSDYAEKARFVRLPKGKQANYNAKQVMDFPIGTAIIKAFYYTKDQTKPAKGRRIIETRVLLHEADGWVALPYVWNDDQTEAILEIAGASKQVQWKDAKGKKHKISYQVPNMVQCKACHSYDKKLVPIGPSARQLNGDFKYASGSHNQLDYWQKQDLLKGLPDLATVPKLERWTNESAAVATRARAYLDANCGHCHNPKGPANTSGMFLDIHTSAPAELGVHKAPIAAGRGTGDRLYGIEPGQPDASILIYRMESKDPGVMMPEVGRQLIHEEGVALVRDWIKAM